MDVTLIDPRDASTELDRPTYRVEIISLDRGRIDTWRISGARNFEDVWAWTEAEKADGSAVIHVEVQTDSGLMLLRLHGVPYGHGHGHGMPAVASG